ncbi:transmembrane and coiled-coil domain protein 3-like [Trichomycterus rosablanca]|uniref:transmembrane and coiled-coil domain protein 3-like n=1 Tax=Trichomycterus rosablanca TaxID=2290929 RepID=UPI002F3511CA
MDDGYVLSIPVPLFRGGSDSNLNTSDLQQKILKVSEQLKVEQMEQDENVAEFLKLVNMADKQQVARIRRVFEKKNQKMAQNISQLQKKLEQYHRRMKESENNNTAKNVTSKDQSKDQQIKDLSRDLLKESPKDVNGGGRQHGADKIRTYGPGVSLTPPSIFNKPREFANLIRNKFGSADNIPQLKNSLDEGGGRVLSGSTTIVERSKYQSDDESSTGTSASADSNGNHAELRADQSAVNLMLEELREIRRSQMHLDVEIEVLKEKLSDNPFLTQMLEEEKYRAERLEEQLNDLVELHQHEMADLKQVLASLEEKVAYQANERDRDLQEALESCHSRLCKLEQQVQVVQVESDAVLGRELLAKAINVLLAFTTLLLVCVSMATRCITPGLRDRVHLLITVLGVVLIALIWRNWDRLYTTGGT